MEARRLSAARAALCLLALFGYGARASAYDEAQLAADAAAFLSAEDRMHMDMAASIAALRKSQPLMSPGQGPALSADLSAGMAVAPSFEYRGLIGSGGPFAGFADSGPADSAEALFAGGAIAFQNGLGLNLNASYSPPLALDGSTKSLLRIGASGYWRLIPERFYSVGALVGGGASYVRGTETRSIGTSFSDMGAQRSFSGQLDSRWNCGVVDLELFLHKTFFIVNFYSRADLCLVFGSTASSLSGIEVDGSAVAGAQAKYSSVLGSPEAGIVLAGGMELILGELKLAAEAGRDWLSGSLYGSVGLRFGM
jgi:hypothetical protein